MSIKLLIKPCLYISIPSIILARKTIIIVFFDLISKGKVYNLAFSTPNLHFSKINLILKWYYLNKISSRV